MTSIARKLEAAELRPIPIPITARRGAVHATHAGEIDIQGLRLRVVRLSDGQRVLDPESCDTILDDGRIATDAPARTLTRYAMIAQLAAGSDADLLPIERAINTVAGHELMTTSHDAWLQLEASTLGGKATLRALHDFLFGSILTCETCTALWGSDNVR